MTNYMCLKKDLIAKMYKMVLEKEKMLVTCILSLSENIFKDNPLQYNVSTKSSPMEAQNLHSDLNLCLCLFQSIFYGTNQCKLQKIVVYSAVRFLSVCVVLKAVFKFISEVSRPARLSMRSRTLLNKHFS